MIKVTKLLITGLCLLCLAIKTYAGSREPVFVPMPAHSHYSVQEALNWYIQQYNLPKGTSFRLINSLNDELGYTHYRYIQTYHGQDIHSTMWLVHTIGNHVESMSGLVVEKLPAMAKPSITEANSLTNALNYVNAKVYKWDLPIEEQYLKTMKNNPTATWYPKAQLMWVSPDISNANIPVKLCYAFDIYAQQPLSRQFVYVDAQNGQVIWSLNRIHTNNVKDTAKTVFSGNRIIMADSTSTSVRILDDKTRGAHIKTLNMQQGTTYGSAIDFTNKTNVWNNVDSVYDEYATDAHWATEMTYDYYKTTFNRNSVDDSGHALYSYVHYSVAYDNAYWDGNEMTYGDGSAQPLTALDVTGHEISHGVTQFTANLNYINESGALNEGFSDCMGKSVEHFARPGKFAWTISDDLSSAFRDMSNPQSLGQPTTYKGTYWYTGAGDNGGVHQNNSILTYWFYLLSEGGNGKNDNGDSFHVHRIGIDTVKRILYRAQSVYNVPSTQYKDARTNTIRAAGDLYGLCGKIYKEVTNAWHAVGVGDTFIPRVVSVPFAIRTNFCSLPAIANFDAGHSANASAFKWYFGDGDSSTLVAPTHKYKAAGSYTVRLKADGGVCGKADSISKNLISISLSAAPSVGNDTICGGGTGSLSVLGGGSNYYIWYDSAVGGHVIDTGITLKTPKVTTTTSFFAEMAQRGRFMHPNDTTFGHGSLYSAGSTHGLIFDASTDVIIKSVLVYSDTADYREIDLSDNSGNILATVNVLIPNGGSRVVLNLFVPKGTGYMLSLNGSGTTRLYRSRSGASYPYTLSGAVNITGNDLGSGFNSYYYFFYNWEVQAGDCRSLRGAGQVVINSGSPKSTVSAAGPTTFCTGGSVKLTASSGSSYAWNTGDTSKSITVTTQGTYYVTVKMGGCNVSSPTDTVNVLAIPAVSISPAGPLTICTGRNVLLTAISTAFKYTWSTGDSTGTIAINKGGVYKVSASNGYCASPEDSIVVNAIAPPTASATIRPTSTNTFEFVNTSSNGTSYYWTFDKGGFSTSPDSFAFTYTGGFPKPGNSVTDTILLVATNTGCSDTVKIPIYHQWYGTGTIDIINGMHIQLYPNPSNSGANIQVNTTQNAIISVDVYDATGRLVKNIFDGEVVIGEKILYLNTQKFSAGLYLLKVSANGNQTQFSRFLINH